MSDILLVSYRHECGCARQGEQITVRPECRDGVAYVVRPECIEKGTQLVETGRNALGPGSDPG